MFKTMQLMIAWINYLWATTWLKPCVSGWWMLTNSTDPKDIQRHWSIVDHHFIALQYPLVNIQKTMENHHFQWVNPRTKSPCSIAILTYPRVSFPILWLQNKHPTPPAFELLNQGTIASACLSWRRDVERSKWEMSQKRAACGQCILAR